jgi:integrase
VAAITGTGRATGQRRGAGLWLVRQLAGQVRNDTAPDVRHGAGCVRAPRRARRRRSTVPRPWLVPESVPVNVVRKVMGHEQASTTLNRYTHTPDDYSARVLAAFDGSAAFPLPSAVHRGDEGPPLCV